MIRHLFNLLMCWRLLQLPRGLGAASSQLSRLGLAHLRRLANEQGERRN